jgi:hypothetical protein
MHIVSCQEHDCLCRVSYIQYAVPSGPNTLAIRSVMVNLSKMPSSRILRASDAHWSAMTSESGEGWARPNRITEAHTTSRRPRGAVPAVTSDTRVGSWIKLETSVSPHPCVPSVGSPDKKALVTSDEVVT